MPKVRASYTSNLYKQVQKPFTLCYTQCTILLNAKSCQCIYPLHAQPITTSLTNCTAATLLSKISKGLVSSPSLLLLPENVTLRKSPGVTRGAERSYEPRDARSPDDATNKKDEEKNSFRPRADIRKLGDDDVYIYTRGEEEWEVYLTRSNQNTRDVFFASRRSRRGEGHVVVVGKMHTRVRQGRGENLFSGSGLLAFLSFCFY